MSCSFIHSVTIIPMELFNYWFQSCTDSPHEHRNILLIHLELSPVTQHSNTIQSHPSCVIPNVCHIWKYIAHIMNYSNTKPPKWPVQPAKAQISLCTCPVWSGSSLYALWVAKDWTFLHENSGCPSRCSNWPESSLDGYKFDWSSFQIVAH